ncbi:MAG: hypothetical protein JSR57_09345 [Verrucomicrobia bacterium]|nr:hypothetical protein [Verrucomicrobiota bacterium]
MFLNPVADALLAIIPQQPNAIQNALADDLVLFVAANQVKGAVEDPELVRVLMKYAENPNEWPVLHYAIYVNDEKAVEVLLRNGIDPNFVFLKNNPKNKKGEPIPNNVSPLYLAIYQKFDLNNPNKINTKIIELLLDSGADPYKFDQGWSSVGWALQIYRAATHNLNQHPDHIKAAAAFKPKAIEIMNIFTSRNIDFNVPCGITFQGLHTPLYAAVYLWKSEELTNFLLQHGARLDKI